MGVYAIKPAFQRRLLPVERALVERGIHPDTLTWGGLAISVAGGAALSLAAAHPLLLLTAPFVAVARTALNALDGMVARDSGRARPWGEVLNELGDRLADVALLGGLALAGFAPGPLAALALIAVLVTSFVGLVAKSAGAGRQYGGVLGKADRMLLLAGCGPAAFVLDAHTVVTGFFGLVLAGSLVTAMQRLRATHAALSRTGTEPHDD